MTNLDLMDQEVLLEHRPCQGLPRVEDGNQGHHVVDLIILHWLDVMFHTSLISLELTLSQRTTYGVHWMKVATQLVTPRHGVNLQRIG